MEDRGEEYQGVERMRGQEERNKGGTREEEGEEGGRRVKEVREKGRRGRRWILSKSNR
jgi:hypothetical protein